MRGTCEECGCTDENACVNEDDVACQWTDAREDFCSACAFALAEATDFERLKADQAYALRVLRGNLYRFNATIAFTAQLIAECHPELGDPEEVLEAALHGGPAEQRLWIPGE